MNQQSVITAHAGAPAPEPGPMLFRPDTFFLKPWRGWGVMRGANGRPLSRYEAAGQGRNQSRSAAIEQRFTFDNGVVQAFEWEILADDEGRFFARDRSGLEARGRQLGDDFCWAYTTKAPTPLGVRKVKVQALYTMVTPDTAFSFTEVKLWGLTLSSFTTYYTRL